MSSVFHIILIRPTRYDPDGYPLQWVRSFMPSNSLSCVYALAEDCRERQVLGSAVEIRLHPIDETVQRVRHDHLIRMIRNGGGRGLVLMVGVQSNQFPRAVDLAGPFLKAGIQVCIGGFHVSGCLAMFDELTPELHAAQQLGISLFAGEAEGQRLDRVFQDAYQGSLQQIYNHLTDLPQLAGQPLPLLPEPLRKNFFEYFATMDLGRGCPFGCSFCTVINVQGRGSRTRNADDLEQLITRHHARPEINTFTDRLIVRSLGGKLVKQQSQCYFLTDDNFSRNSNWKTLLDRFILLRERDGITVRLQIQVDTKCHQVPGFIEKCVAAGVDQVFIGIESLRNTNLAEANKGQNHIEDYRAALMAWKKHPVVIIAAYIIGFPGDTSESVFADVDTIKQELPVDLVHFTMLTPLPGSEDHRKMVEDGIWMDPDLNKYALANRVTEHPRHSIAEWESIYGKAYDRFYTQDHIETILKRMVALGSNKKKTTIHSIMIYANGYKTYGIHPLEAGFFRRKSRLDRRPGQTIENPLIFYGKYILECVTLTIRTYRTLQGLRKTLQRIWTDPRRFDYRDRAIRKMEETKPEQEVTKKTR